MISYYEQSKGKIAISEDSLTSMVFDQLKYLPSELFWNILKRAVYYDKLPRYSGELLEIFFWQKWNVRDSALNQNVRFVEPDVFLRYEEFDLVVEAKRHDEKQQSDMQHKEQMSAYFYNYFEDNKQLYYLQMGGLRDKSDVSDYLPPPLIIDGDREVLKKVVILKTDWSELLNSIITEESILKSVSYSDFNSYRRILIDLIKGFELFQFYSPKWLKDLKERRNITETFKDKFRYV